MSCRAIPILASLLLAWLSAGCQTNPEVSSPLRSDVTEIIGEDKNFVVVRAGATESYEALATRYYADPAKAWLLREENGSQRLTPGQFVVVPRSEQNAIGVRHDSYQVVPILSYHHFGARRGRLSVTAEQFTEQLDYLRRNGYTVARLSDFHAFLEGRRRLPRKSVVITIDDGYRSVYDVAFPILREYNVPATVFIYSDFIGKGGLTKKQMAQMEASGLVDMQAHSKTHANLTETVVGESPADYRARVQA
ncbi:MAG: polysaccharide deacetylase family protein, partial [Gammaproteobacteria bacterium]|nr:polysaccharide deacetylase family protein [Gammaproteobacteria bacterium]